MLAKTLYLYKILKKQALLCCKKLMLFAFVVNNTFFYFSQVSVDSRLLVSVYIYTINK